MNRLLYLSFPKLHFTITKIFFTNLTTIEHLKDETTESCARTLRRIRQHKRKQNSNIQTNKTPNRNNSPNLTAITSIVVVAEKSLKHNNQQTLRAIAFLV
jgi:hypothetical protein